MALILLASGIFFAVLLLLNNLLKTITRRVKIGFLDLLLVFLVTLVTVTGLIANNTDETPDPLVERGALLLAFAVIGMSLLIIILEIFRPQRLKGSRGILGIFGGVLLVISTFSVPFAAVYFSIESTAGSGQNQTPSTVEATDQLVERTERFDTLFRAVRQVIAEEIEVDEVLVFTQLDEGKPLAEIVEENGGDVERVIERLSEIMKAGIRDAASRGEMNALQAALLVSQMDNLVRVAVNANLLDFGSRFGGPTPTGTRPSLLTLLTETATVAISPSATATPTLTATPSNTATPTDTNTPRPTPTPSATRFHFSTRTPTPTPTPTPVTPCLAEVQYNLRLRAQPSQDAETLLVIPYATPIELYGHSADAIWWLTTYEGQIGWVDGTYLILSAACGTLPTLDSTVTTLP